MPPSARSAAANPRPSPSAGDGPVGLFFERVLPTLLRRLQMWKGLDQELHGDVIDDLRQEVWLDYLQHTDQLNALSIRERHARWLRLLSNHHYRLRERPQRRREGDAALLSLPQQETSDPLAAFDQQQPEDRELLGQLLRHGRYLKNGKLNFRASARRLQVSVRQFHRLRERLLAQAGMGQGYLDRWRRHLGRGLLAVAADRLRDQGPLWIHTGEGPVPQPCLRVQKAREQLRRRPMATIRLRRLVRSWDRERLRSRRTTPVALLRDAAWLLPGEWEVHLWMAEAALAAHDLRRAAVALRAARRLNAPVVSTVLGRLRLLDLRGCRRLARDLLQRSLCRHGAEPRLEAMLRRLGRAAAPLLKRVS